MVVLSSGESHLFAANVSQQEQLRGVEKVELSPVNTVKPERRISLHRIHQPNATRINTYIKIPGNPRVMNTYAIALLESLLESTPAQKVGRGWGLSSVRFHRQRTAPGSGRFRHTPDSLRSQLHLTHLRQCRRPL